MKTTAGYFEPAPGLYSQPFRLQASYFLVISLSPQIFGSTCDTGPAYCSTVPAGMVQVCANAGRAVNDRIASKNRRTGLMPAAKSKRLASRRSLKSLTNAAEATTRRRHLRAGVVI